MWSEAADVRILLDVASKFDQHHMLKTVSFLKCDFGYSVTNEVSVGV